MNGISAPIKETPPLPPREDAVKRHQLGTIGRGPSPNTTLLVLDLRLLQLQTASDTFLLVISRPVGSILL